MAGSVPECVKLLLHLKEVKQPECFQKSPKIAEFPARAQLLLLRSTPVSLIAPSQFSLLYVLNMPANDTLNGVLGQMFLNFF